MFITVLTSKHGTYPEPDQSSHTLKHSGYRDSATALPNRRGSNPSRVSRSALGPTQPPNKANTSQTDQSAHQNGPAVPPLPHTPSARRPNGLSTKCCAHFSPPLNATCPTQHTQTFLSSWAWSLAACSAACSGINASLHRQTSCLISFRSFTTHYVPANHACSVDLQTTDSTRTHFFSQRSAFKKARAVSVSLHRELALI